MKQPTCGTCAALLRELQQYPPSGGNIDLTLPEKVDAVVAALTHLLVCRAAPERAAE